MMRTGIPNSKSVADKMILDPVSNCFIYHFAFLSFISDIHLDLPSLSTSEVIFAFQTLNYPLIYF